MVEVESNYLDQNDLTEIRNSLKGYFRDYRDPALVRALYRQPVGKPEWLTEQMKKNGWHPVDTERIMLLVCHGCIYQGAKESLLLVLKKEPGGEQPAGWTKHAGWELELRNSDFSSLVKCNLKICAELTDYCSYNDQVYATKGETEHPGVAVDAFGLSLYCDGWHKTQKIRYKIYDPVSSYVCAEGELNFVD